MADEKNARIGIDDKETTQMTPIDEIRSVQLNEKVSDTTYQILHPETDAYQVITNPERRFVSEEEKKKWNKGAELAASALHYKGLYDKNTLYAQYDVVTLLGGDVANDSVNHYGDKGQIKDPSSTAVVNDSGARYFVYVNELATQEAPVKAPKPKYDEFYSNGWVNFNFESYLAENASNIQLSRDTTGTFNFALIDDESGEYTKVVTSTDFAVDPTNKTITIGSAQGGVVLNGSTGTVTAPTFVGHLQGRADEATVSEKYYLYNRDVNGTPILDGDKRVVKGSDYIEDEFRTVHDRIDKMDGGGEGGAKLSYPLDIQKGTWNAEATEGEPEYTYSSLLTKPFDGTRLETAKISFTAQEIGGLVRNGKISNELLPDALLGAMSYIGTFDAEQGLMVTDLRPQDEAHPEKKRPFRKGDYAIASTAGDKDPSGAVHALDSAETTYFIVGDWAVYNGDLDNDNTIDAEEWSKVDNTDAVRMVNSQIGNVETYKGAWVSGTYYYKGDIVEHGEEKALYVCILNNDDAEFSETNFKIFGRLYKAADGIELTEVDNTFRHLWKGAKDVVTGSVESPIVLQPKDTITVSNIERNDVYGHIKNNNITTYQLPDDTWRNIKLNGTEIQDTTVTSGPLDLNHDLGDADRRVTISSTTPEGGTPVITVVHNLNKQKPEDPHAHKSETVGADTVLQDTDVEIPIGIGTKFTAPNLAWDKTGHIDAYHRTIFSLPEDTIQHKHFYVAIGEDKKALIRSYTAMEYAAALDKNRLFYDASLDTGLLDVPTSKEKMGFNGIFNATEFYQTGALDPTDNVQLHRVIDETAKIISGKDYRGNKITGTFVRGEKEYEFQLGKSGIHELDTPVVYSAIAVNKQGIGVAGGQILEFGTFSAESGPSDPSDGLVIGGLFFRNMGPDYKDNNGIV